LPCPPFFLSESQFTAKKPGIFTAPGFARFGQHLRDFWGRLFFNKNMYKTLKRDGGIHAAGMSNSFVGFLWRACWWCPMVLQKNHHPQGFILVGRAMGPWDERRRYGSELLFGGDLHR
jgi:hypothetical protein